MFSLLHITLNTITDLMSDTEIISGPNHESGCTRNQPTNLTNPVTKCNESSVRFGDLGCFLNGISYVEGGSIQGNQIQGRDVDGVGRGCMVIPKHCATCVTMGVF